MSVTQNPILQKSELVPLFPTLVWKFQLEEEAYRALNERVIRKLNELRPASEDIPAGGVWQTRQDLQRLEEFADLTSCIESATRGALDFLKVIYESFEITGCWANVAASGGWHPTHNHPNNYLSGVYYVKAPSGADRITFHDPRGQRIIAPHLRELNEFNASEATLEVHEGLLIVFPSWLMHSVGYNESDQERISVSFNVMFSNFAETMCHPKWQPNSDPKGR